MKKTACSPPSWAQGIQSGSRTQASLFAPWTDLQRFVEILARISGVELFIINSELLCIAGSGPYASAIGCTSPADTAIGYSLTSGRPTLVLNPRMHETCKACSQRSECRDVSNYTTPLMIDQRCVAAVQIVAFDAAQGVRMEEQAADLAEAISLMITRMCSANPHLLTMLIGLRDEAERSPGLARIVGESTIMRTLKDNILRAAPLDSTVLVQGESGTGKELVAQAIHELSPRRAAPFVAVNCGAIPESIIESELFGYEAGAFTGAQRGGKAGLFEHTHGGTLFLDEIAELPISLQVRLLRVLQERKVMRLGARKERSFDVRIIAAANTDLAEKTRNGSFRQDLYYRLAVVPVYVPALRERNGDIELLVHHFVRLYARLRNEAPPTVDAALMQCFRDYSWPGNVRELKNFVEYGVNFRHGENIGMEILADRFDQTTVRLHQETSLYNTLCPGSHSVIPTHGEDTKLRETLQRFGTSVEGKRLTAAHLGISMATLYRKLKRLEHAEAYRYKKRDTITGQ